MLQIITCVRNKLTLICREEKRTVRHPCRDMYAGLVRDADIGCSKVGSSQGPVYAVHIYNSFRVLIIFADEHTFLIYK